MDKVDRGQRRDWYPAFRIVLRVTIFVLLIWLTHLAVGWLMVKIEDLENAAGVRIGVLGALLLVYVLLMAVPFVPGAEIGISLMMLEGGTLAPFVYCGTLLGLSLAYFVGRRVDCAVFKQIATDLRLTSVSDLIDEIIPMDGEQRQKLLQARLPKWVPTAVIRYKYIVLGLLLNLPGNAIIGGGGGLALIAGFSGLYATRPTALTLAIAVAPVPAMVYFLDLYPFG
ncbi:hypothetical protein [Pacificibacter marinus]|uniref:TVP38/TMEM64 family membrane protein n=1 Tax=Pacificibacter marinus TaxID=658057 RepID=A0A1Y5RUI0_9RHOB|nr:hypothetical protein [Pacificibacter marinus]SEK39801.1 hypothetical protein SAMN04488032_102189 [Pacificibacter marinus]SLN25398.1 hypothetical protein PAM7971_00898 [Pacificibacter marinus]